MNKNYSRLVLRSRRTILPGKNQPEPASVVIEHGKIRELRGYDEAPPVAETIDAGDSILMPGIVDTHVHINEPGRTDWEGFVSATRAAAVGGITTIVDMPLNSIPATVDVEALHEKASSARGHCAVDYGFWGGVIPGNSGELSSMVAAGALGFKAFLIDSGVPEFPMVGEGDLRAAMPVLAAQDVPLLVHAELESKPAPGFTSRSYHDYLESRPSRWEVDAIRMMIRLARETGCRVHIVHLSCADALEDLRRARADGVAISVETCPHYLFFCAEDIPDGATHFKCAPPIRERENAERLWQGLIDRVIDFVVSDHSPCLPNLKRLDTGDFQSAWGGISGLQFGLSVVWTAMRQRGLSPAQLAGWMCAAPARFVGIEAQKGEIAVGKDADLVVWNPEQAFRLEPSAVRHRHSITPYSGREWWGAVEMTFLRGKCIYDRRAEALADSMASGVQIFKKPQKVESL